MSDQTLQSSLFSVYNTVLSAWYRGGGLQPDPIQDLQCMTLAQSAGFQISLQTDLETEKMQTDFSWQLCLFHAFAFVQTVKIWNHDLSKEWKYFRNELWNWEAKWL